jgi:DNA recombination protein RmuC
MMDDQKTQLTDMVTALRGLEKTHVQEQEKALEVLGKKFQQIQEGNEKKLEEMRQTVDEKLHNTLEKRLGESFQLVSKQLEAVHTGLGDMQKLATGVGDLKRVLTNVKERGTWGEYQLEAILEQILTVDQFARNVQCPGCLACREQVMVVQVWPRSSRSPRSKAHPDGPPGVSHGAS